MHVFLTISKFNERFSTKKSPALSTIPRTKQILKNYLFLWIKLINTCPLERMSEYVPLKFEKESWKLGDNRIICVFPVQLEFVQQL